MYGLRGQNVDLLLPEAGEREGKAEIPQIEWVEPGESFLPGASNFDVLSIVEAVARLSRFAAARQEEERKKGTG